MTEERSDVVPRIGAAQRDRRAEWLAGWCLDDTPRPPHAPAREYASKGCYRNLLRNPNDLRGRERIAHHNLALRPVPRPPGADGGVRRVRDLRAAAQFHRRFDDNGMRPQPAADRGAGG